MMQRLTLEMPISCLPEAITHEWLGQQFSNAFSLAERNRIHKYNVNESVRSSYDDILEFPLRFPALTALTLDFSYWHIESDETVSVSRNRSIFWVIGTSADGE